MIELTEQDKFDLVIGRLDRILSELINYSRSGLSRTDRQTLKHHAKDMIAAGEKILEDLPSEARGMANPNGSD